MAQAARQLSPAAYHILEASCLSRVSATKCAERIGEATGEQLSARTASRLMKGWRSQRGRIAILKDLGLCLAALRGEEDAFQTLAGRVQFSLEHELRAGEVVRSVQRFIRHPNPVAFAELLVSAQLFQLEAALLGQRKVRRG